MQAAAKNQIDKRNAVTQERADQAEQKRTLEIVGSVATSVATGVLGAIVGVVP